MLFTRARSSGVGSASPRKAESRPDILQNDFAHSHWQLQAIQDKQFFFGRRENCWKRRRRPTIPYRHALKVSTTWHHTNPPSPPSPNFQKPLHLLPALSQVSLSEDGGNSWIVLQTSHNSVCFFFLSPFIEAVDNFDKSFVCPAGVWLGCGFR